MKAIVTQLNGDGSRFKSLVDNWADPAPPTGNQVKVKAIYTGVTNGTERNDLTGGNYARPDHKLPAPWGYQNVGKVIEVGPDVKELAVGDIVYSSTNHFEYAVFAEDGLAVKLPNEVDPVDAALFGMASVAMHTCANADIKQGERVLVVGAGFIGQIATQIAAIKGGAVDICDIDDSRLDDAKQIGMVKNVFNTSKDKWEELIASDSYDVVIDLAGVPDMIDSMIAAAKFHGRVLLIAGRFDVNYNFNKAQLKEVTIKHNSHFYREDLYEVCRLTASGALKIHPLIKEVVPVTESKAIYDRLIKNPNSVGGTVFDWQGV